MNKFKFKFQRDCSEPQAQSINGFTFTCEEVLPTRDGHGMEVRGTFTDPEGNSRVFERVLVSRLNKLAHVTESRSTVIPKCQRASVTASNKGTTITVRYKRGGDSASIRNLAYARIDALRAEQRRLEREINLLIAFTRAESFDLEHKVLQAREEATNGRKRDMQARAKRLQHYIDTYAERVGKAMMAGNLERAQVLVATQAERLSRAQQLIAELSK